MHGGVAARAEDDLGVVAHGVVDDVVDLGGLAQGEIVAADDVDQDAGGAGDRNVVEQRARDGLLGGFERAVVAPADAGAHERRAAVLHDGAHVGEVHVDDAGAGDQAGDALRGVEEDFVGLLERLLERDPLADDREQPLVGDHDHRVHVLPQLGDPLLRLLHPTASLEQERLGHDADGEGAGLAGHLRHDRRGSGAGAAAHAAGHEDHVGALDRLRHLVAVLLDGLAPDLGPGPGAEAAGQLPADLDLDVRFRDREGLRVGVDRDELDPAELVLDHPVDGVPAAPTDTHDLHPRGLDAALFQLKNHGLFPRPDSEEVLEPPFHRSEHLLDRRRLLCPRPEAAARHHLPGTVEHQSCRYCHSR